jgi:phosphatidylglycerophosphatase C
MPNVAAFDLDGTLTEGGSVFDFLAAVAGRPAVVAASVALSPRLAHAALVGGEVADTTKERLFGRLLAGVEVERLERVARSFAERHVDRHLRADVFRRLAWHQRRGDRVVIVSASPAAYAGPIGELLGVDHVIATGLAVEGDRLTGRYEGRNCRGEEKLRRLHTWMEVLDGTPALWAYGNSRGDLRMLEAADFGFNVGHLGSLGRLRRFAGLDEPVGGDRAGRS